MNRILRFAAFGALLLSSLASLSQQKDAEEPAAKPAPALHYYKLNFVLKESDEGKMINQRSFALATSASPTRGTGEDRSSVRAGIRLPIGPSDKGGMTYVDVGTNIDAYRVTETADGLQMVVNTEISSVAAETAGRADSTPFRQVRASSSVLAPLGKATMVFSADDPVSKHRFELEVTPARER